MNSDPSDRRNAPRADDPELRGRRSERRAYLLLPASAEALSGHRSVKLLDVSRGGARIEGSGLPAVRKEVILRCGGLDTFGTIAWATDGQRGIGFVEPISVQDLVALRSLSEVAARSPLTPDEQQGVADWMNGLAR